MKISVKSPYSFGTKHWITAKGLQIYIFYKRLLTAIVPKTTLCKGIKFKKDECLDPKASQIWQQRSER